MASLNGFNAHEVDPNVGFDPVPAGKYMCVITASEMKVTKAGTGRYLELEFEVVDGPCKGRKLWDRLTLEHPNETTVKIARGSLSAICRATGVMAPRDSCELHGIPIAVGVGLKRREDTQELTNTIKSYTARGADAGQAAPPSNGRASSGAEPPPWKKPANA